MTKANDVTVVIPVHPARMKNGMFMRAMNSIAVQTLPAAAVAVAVDVHREGAAKTRQRALMAAETPWVAFLDSDDLFKPIHLERLMAHALETGADFVFSWFDVLGGWDPFPDNFAPPFDPANPIETTVTTLVRTGIAQQVGFRALDRGQINSGEDRFFTLGCIEAGAQISHLKERTWIWSHHGGNTSGLPGKGDAK